MKLKKNQSIEVCDNKPFSKDLLKYKLEKRIGHRRKLDECTKWHSLRTASNKMIFCSNVIHDLNL